MAVIWTAIVRVRDWRALGRLNRGVLVERARALGSTRFRIYRDVHDASQALLVAELPDHDAVADLGKEVSEHLAALVAGQPDGRTWEPTELEAIE
jgi:hypothetical protein